MRYLAFLLLFWFPASSITNYRPGARQKYTPNENSPFNMTQINRDGGGLKKKYPLETAWSTQPCWYARNFILAIERRLFKPVTIILGVLGKAFGGDFIQGTYLEALDFWEEQAIMLLTYQHYTTTPIITIPVFFYREAFGFIFSGTAFDGGFFEFLPPRNLQNTMYKVR